MSAIRQIAWALARRFEGGVETAAREVGKPYETFRRELAGAAGYKLGADELDVLTQAAVARGIDDPLAIVNRMAQNVGALVLQLPQQVDDGGDTFKCLAEAAQEFGVFMREVAETMADGSVSDNELREVEVECSKLMGKVRACLGNLRAINEAAKPQSLRAV
jgi:hypothetical protein